MEDVIPPERKAFVNEHGAAYEMGTFQDSKLSPRSGSVNSGDFGFTARRDEGDEGDEGEHGDVYDNTGREENV